MQQHSASPPTDGSDHDLWFILEVTEVTDLEVLTPHTTASVITSDLLIEDLKEAAQTERDEHSEHEESERTGGVCVVGVDETRLKSQPLKSRWKM